MNIKKGDTVEVISGNERGKRGEVVKVLPGRNRVVVKGVNFRKKHQRQAPSGGRQQLAPGIIQFEGSLDASNVMLVCPKCDEPTRVGRAREDGKAMRVCRNCAAAIDA